MIKKKISELILPAYHQVYKSMKRYHLIIGSRASGKSANIALILIISMVKFADLNILVLRAVDKDNRTSTYNILKWAIHKLGLDAYFKCNKSPLEIEYLPTGQLIFFRGMNDPQSIASITVPKGYIAKVWLEEASQIKEESDFDTIDETIRAVLSPDITPQFYITMNPFRADHWTKKRFFDTPDEETLAIRTTYLQNPYLTEADLKLYERMKVNNPTRYLTAGLGHWGSTEGLLYNFGEKNIIDKMADNYIEFSAGIDYGIKKDAFTIAVIGYTQGFKEAHLIYEYYHSNDKALNKKTHNDYIADTMEFFKQVNIVMEAHIDNSASFLVEFLNERTYKDQFFKVRFKECKKLPIETRVGYMEGLIDDGKFKIYRGCPNAIREYSTIEKAQVGTLIRQGSDHIIDASEYGLTPFYKLLLKETFDRRK